MWARKISSLCLCHEIMETFIPFLIAFFFMSVNCFHNQKSNKDISYWGDAGVKVKKKKEKDLI